MSTAYPILRLPSQKYLRERFTYNRRTGELRWKRRPREHFDTYKGWAIWNGKYAGARAGNIKPNGYRRVIIDGVSYLEHRVIWKLTKSNEPHETLDHKNKNPSDNRGNNLRAANQQQQKWNMNLRKDNKSGYRGVSRLGKRWVARIKLHGEYRHLGCFGTREEAAVAYTYVARKLHGEFFSGV